MHKNTQTLCSLALAGSLGQQAAEKSWPLFTESFLYRQKRSLFAERKRLLS
jgi:hypothetical protein